MGSLSQHQNNNNHDVTIILVPFPAQGHLNQLLQLSCLLSSFNLPVHYVSSSTHNRQATTRVNGLNPLHVAKIRFHDLPTPSFAVPPPNPDSSDKFPVQLHPAWEATLTQREPFLTFLREISQVYRRVVIIHDPMMSYIVQDVGSVPNAESYAFNCIPAFCQVLISWQAMQRPLPEELEKLPPLGAQLPIEVQKYVNLQYEFNSLRTGDLHNSCRIIEAQYLEMLANEDLTKKQWAIGPILPTKMSPDKRHECFNWLDKQEANSVIYVSFGTTTSLPDEQVRELALGLEQSKQRFLWVLRDADKGNVFEGEARRPNLPEGFEERVEGVGLIVREWAPQPEILAHPSVGGFLSHCGWNSCIESITMGVPIAGWPMHSDQPSNSALVSEILKIGFVVREWAKSEELVEASIVENAVKRLMASEEGEVLRKRAEELAVTVRNATEEGGASRIELEAFIAHITRKDDETVNEISKVEEV